jgi:prepilin-type N-terminal cleavage/methylation domain-containing protein
MQRRQSGFTLIELLLAVSILGFLITVTSITINIGRIKGRDSQRIADLTQMTKALDLYYQEHGAYPSTHSTGIYNGSNCVRSNQATWLSYLGAELDPYIDKMPIDPVNSQGCNLPYQSTPDCYIYAYCFIANPQYEGGTASPQSHSYDLLTRLETRNHEKSCQNEGKKNFFFDDSRIMCDGTSNEARKQIYNAAPF